MAGLNRKREKETSHIHVRRGKVWRALNLANWLSVGISEVLIWRSEFLSPYIGARAIIYIGEFVIWRVCNLATFTEFAKSPNKKLRQSFLLYGMCCIQINNSLIHSGADSPNLTLNLVIVLLLYTICTYLFV